MFDEIRPYETGEMQQAFKELLDDRQFNKMLKGLVPWIPKSVRNGLLRLAFRGVETPLQFQMRFMKPIVKNIIRRHTDGCIFDDQMLFPDDTTKAAKQTTRYTFVSNHRDIVLDSAFLDIMLIEADYPTTVEIGIGDNLLIYPWIKRLVRMNKAFTVRRGLTPKEMLHSSQLMSQYIHHAVNDKHENIWIAQREGRAKDSDDRTQESVLKMLAMGGKGDNLCDKLRDLNIVPLTISYEFDPCDYLKTQEFQQKHDNPSFKKSRQDDLDNMKTGITGYKGRVHYRCAAPINTLIDKYANLPKNEFFTAISQRIDIEIHKNYTLFPSNYIAVDLVRGNNLLSSHYTNEEKNKFQKYITTQLAKINLSNKDEELMREYMLTMYANPLFNLQKAEITL